MIGETCRKVTITLPNSLAEELRAYARMNNRTVASEAKTAVQLYIGLRGDRGGLQVGPRQAGSADGRDA